MLPENSSETSSETECAAASLRDSLAVLVSRSFPSDAFALFMRVATVQFRANEACKAMAVRFAGLETAPSDARATGELNRAGGLVSAAKPARPEAVERAVLATEGALAVTEAWLDRLGAPDRI